MITRTIAKIAALALLLAACAPAAVGTSSGNPYPASAGSPTVKRGDSVYVRVDYPLDRLGLGPADLRPAMWVPSGYDSEIGDLTGQFSLGELRIAEGWQFELHLVRAERSSESGSGAFDADRTVYSLWAVYEVTAPQEAIPGPYRMRGVLSARGGGEQDVSFQVELVP